MSQLFTPLALRTTPGLALIVGLLAVAPAQAANSCVNPGGTGGCFATIQAAVDDAGTINGDTITVAAGAYAGSVLINKQVSIVGPNQGLAASAARSPEAEITGGVQLQESNVTIDGMKLSGTASIAYAAKIVQTDNAQRSNITIRSNLFEDVADHAIDHAEPVAGSGGTDWLIENNIVDGWVNNNGTAIILHNASNATVQNNVIRNDNATTGERGIQINTVPGAVVDNNEITGLSTYGMQVASSFADLNGVTLSDNRISSTPQAINLRPDRGNAINSVAITGNVISNVSISAVWLRSDAVAGDTFGNVQITGNDIDVDASLLSSPTALALIHADLRAISAPHGALTVTGNSVDITGVAPANVSPNVLLLGGSIGTATVTGNDFDGKGVVAGGGSTVPATGVAISTNSAVGGPMPGTTQISVADTTIEGFQSGLMAYDFNASQLGGLATGTIVDVERNRIVGNSQDGVQNGGIGATNATIDATNNWWGCNGGPGTAGCDAVSGLVNSSPWQVLNLSAAPASIASGGGTSALVADLTRNSAGAAIAGAFPDDNGTGVGFATSLGSVVTPRTTVNGQATSTLTSGSTSGTASVSAALDNAAATAAVQINALNDKTAPKLKTRMRSRQRNGALGVSVQCDEACTVNVAGTVNVPRASKVYRLKRVRRSLKAGQRATIKLKFSNKLRRAVRRTLRKRKRVRGTLRIRATDAAGNSRNRIRRLQVVR